MSVAITHTPGEFNWDLNQWQVKHNLFGQVTWWGKGFKAEGYALFYCPNPLADKPEFWRVSPVFTTTEQFAEWQCHESNRIKVQSLVKLIKQCIKSI